jgi:hypothetical protein
MEVSHPKNFDKETTMMNQDLLVSKRHRELWQAHRQAGGCHGKRRCDVGQHPELWEQARNDYQALVATKRDQLIQKIAGSALTATLLGLVAGFENEETVKDLVAKYNQARWELLVARLSEKGLAWCTRCRGTRAGPTHLVYFEGERVESKSDCSYDYWTWVKTYSEIHESCSSCYQLGTFTKTVDLPALDRSGRATIHGQTFIAEERDGSYFVHYTAGERDIHATASYVEEIWTGSRPLIHSADGFSVEFPEQWSEPPTETRIHRFGATDLANLPTSKLEIMAYNSGLLPELKVQQLYHQEKSWQLCIVDYAETADGDYVISQPDQLLTQLVLA